MTDSGIVASLKVNDRDNSSWDVARQSIGKLIIERAFDCRKRFDSRRELRVTGHQTDKAPSIGLPGGEDIGVVDAEFGRERID